MTVGEEQDHRVGLTVWAQDARVRSASYAAQAVRAAESATAIRQQVDRIIGRMAQRNPEYADQLQAILATAVSRRAAIAELRNNGSQPSSAPRSGPGDAAVTEQEGQRRDMAIIRERDRVVGKLHDQVIQRVFAAGLALQDAADLTAEPDVRWRIEVVADDLDGLIRVIRGAVFDPAD
jgi:signal transduction histidine kinase